MKLEQRMGLIKHRQKPTSRAHQGRHSFDDGNTSKKLGSVGESGTNPRMKIRVLQTLLGSKFVGTESENGDEKKEGME